MYIIFEVPQNSLHSSRKPSSHYNTVILTKRYGRNFNLGTNLWNACPSVFLWLPLCFRAYGIFVFKASGTQYYSTNPWEEFHVLGCSFASSAFDWWWLPGVSCPELLGAWAEDQRGRKRLAMSATGRAGACGCYSDLSSYQLTFQR